jgi:hypothetical protein
MHKGCGTRPLFAAQPPIMAHIFEVRGFSLKSVFISPTA